MKSRRVQDAGVESPGTLRELARACGVQTSYRDMFGRRKIASAQSLLAVLQALGVEVNGWSQVPEALRQRRRQRWETALEPVIPAWDGALPELELRLEAGRARARAECRIALEGGEELRAVVKLDRDGSPIEQEGKRYVVFRIRWGPKLPSGYHRLSVECGEECFESLIIAAPRRVYGSLRRTWGLFLPMYALRTEDSWGAGNFSDLEALHRWVEELGGGPVATLPFLAAFLKEPFDPSPYSPASRLFWNEFYVDPRRAEEFTHCVAAQRLVNSAAFQRETKTLRAKPLVDYRRLMALKRGVIEQLARWLARNRSSQRYQAFRQYVDSHPALRDYAAFRAAGERLGAPWPEWPEPLRSGVIPKRAYDSEAQFYHLYAQWVAEEQVTELAGTRSDARSGLYLDFPLGVHAHGYDVWRERELFARDASGGAPPDTLFIGGQNWGFPPLHPEAIRKQGYRYFIACLRHQFRHAGMLRMDHVMGLHRLFWVPKGMEARDGVYVKYNAEELYAILALESHRYKSVLVGENLGTVPGYVNRAMSRHGVQKMYVLQYEVAPKAGNPLRRVPANAMASLNTHDMPPLTAFLQGDDLEDLRRLGWFTAGEVRQGKQTRRAIRRALARFFDHRGVLASDSKESEDSEDSERLLKGCLEWLAASPARLVLVNLEDLWLETLPQNVPGTNHERPNWRRKARYGFEEFRERPEVIERLRRLSELCRRGKDRR